MQTATIQRRIETLPALSRAGWKQSGEPCALKGACTVRREALGRPRQRRSAPTLRDRPRAPGGASAPSRARPTLAGSPHTEDQDCSWPINRNRPRLDVLVFAPEMLVRPQRAPGAGMTEGKPSCPITRRSYRTRAARDTRGALAVPEGA